MSTALQIDGRALHPIKEAAKETTYTRDYITRLAREDKIVATTIGRQWFVDVDSLKTYAEAAALEQDVRRKQLSEERKQERDAREAAQRQHTLHIKKAKTLHARSFVTASLVLGFGLLSGLATHELMMLPNSSISQTAQVAKSSAPIRLDSVSEDVSSESVNNLVAVDSAASPVVIADQPTNDMRSLGDAQNGILLFPQNGNTDDVSEMFSDVVKVREALDGLTEVVRVDASGQPVGNAIPFVVVPVEQTGQDI